MSLSAAVIDALVGAGATVEQLAAAMKADLAEGEARLARQIPWPKLRQMAFARDGDCCAYCNTDEGPFEVDHIVPQIAGGENVLANVAVSCRSCNRAKRDRQGDDWEALRDRRERDRIRKRKSRGDDGQTRNSANVTRTSPDSPAPLVSPLPLSPDPLPQPPYNPPTPANPVRAKSSGFGPPERVSVEAWDGFCKQRKKRMTQIAFDGIVERLAEHANDLWPPDRLVRRAIECGHETIWPPPKDERNGQSRTNRLAGSRQPGGRTGDGLINAIRESRSNREAVPWDANDPSAVPRLASMG